MAAHERRSHTVLTNSERQLRPSSRYHRFAALVRCLATLSNFLTGSKSIAQRRNDRHDQRSHAKAMSTHNLDTIFKPQRIAVIGASRGQEAWGQPSCITSSIRAPTLSSILSIRNTKRFTECTPGQASVTFRTFLIWPSSAFLPTKVPEAVHECGAAGVRGIVILSAGFREVGESGRELERQTAEEARKFPGLRIVGPNCLGVIVPGLRLNASFARQLPLPGHVAFISQSGALCTAILDWAEEKGLGFSYFVSIGNMLDVDLGDLIDYFGQQPEVRSIILYAESVTNARKFMSAARAFARVKPIVAYKSGRFAESAKAAASHTGAMAGEDAVFDAAFQRAGIERCYEIDDLFDCAELLAWQRPPAGPRLAIVTNAGGPGVMAADALLAREGVLASLSSATSKPSTASCRVLVARQSGRRTRRRIRRALSGGNRSRP